MNCCCEKSLELKIKKGESIGFAFSLTENDIPVDLTDSQMVMEVRENVEDTGEYVLTKTISISSDEDEVGRISDAENGKFFFKVNEEDVASLSTSKPYFVAVYHVNGDLRSCISANNHQTAKFLVLNP